MSFVLSSIISILLALPLQTVSYMKTLAHLDEHQHEHVANSDHHQADSHDHESIENHDEATNAAKHHHHHGPNQSPHNHDRDIWSLFAMQATGPNNTLVVKTLLSWPLQGSPPADQAISRNITESLFRPPIS